MQVITRISELRSQIAEWRRAGERIAFAPTMGNLHDGHIDLVRRARQQAQRVVVSVFVNPLQFGRGEDFERYPRTPEADAGRLRQAGADLLFLPEAAEVYPEGIESQTRIEVPGLSDVLCGAFRPGHFSGVATVVNMLFNMVQPDIALFGEKDYQQLAVIRRMTADLKLPVTIVGVPTVREASGLAMSSRNQYLTEAERAGQAPRLYRALQVTADALAQGRSDYAALEAGGAQALTAAGFRVDYFAIRNRDLHAPASAERELVVLAAAWLGRARLIDNLTLSR